MTPRVPDIRVTTAVLGSIALSIAAAPAAQAYVVEPGDTVSGIADRHGLRTSDVLARNGLGPEGAIFPGQVLDLGVEAAVASVSPVEAVPAGSHTVAAGDTLWAVADAAGIDLETLLTANGLTPSSIIYPGQTLTVPGTAVAAGHGLDGEQVAHARVIIQAGRDRGVPDRGIAIALATAMVESWLRNLDWGDSDSLGLFQQRPSMGWGSADEVRDPYRAAAAFYGGEHDPNGWDTRGLLDVDGWESMGFSEAAQAVQLSAFPERYGAWEGQAWSWLSTLG